MRILGTIRMLGAVGILSCSLWAQTAVPGPLGSEVPPLATGSEESAKDVLTFKLRTAATFDDNALANNRDRVSNTEFDFQPGIDFREEFPRLNWDLYYDPGFSFSHLANQRAFSQLGGFNLGYQLFQHVELKLRGQTTITSNPFDQLDRNQLAPQTGLLDRPNTSVVQPQMKQIAESISPEVDWFLSAHTTATFSGGISDLRYQHLPGDNSESQLKLINTRIVTAHGALLHDLSSWQTIGAFYDYQDLAFPLAHGRTVTHSWEAMDEFKIHSNMTLTVFAGPEYSRMHDQVELNLLFFTIEIPTFKTMWSVTGGADYTWQGQHNALHASFIRKVSDGGGLIGSVQLRNAQVDFRRQLTRRWTFNLGGGYAISDALGFAGSSKLQGYSANAGFERMIRPDLFFNIGYSRLHQSRRGSIAGLSADDHNRVVVSLEYQWHHPVGR